MKLSAPGAMDSSLAAIQQPGMPQQLLVSSGLGELALVSTADTGTAVSAPVQPLPQAQPFILEAAYRVSAGRYLAGPFRQYSRGAAPSVVMHPTALPALHPVFGNNKHCIPVLIIHWRDTGNDVRCILWSIQPRSGSQPAHCKVHVVTLRCPPGPGAHLEASLALCLCSLIVLWGCSHAACPGHPVL